ncbi:tyrosine-type recombinase/integrase [Sporosarcina sp. P33]|uniref:tyrosine-type recombinase/integrase n=1 Tax=Sporosarcina sp. P33 TaxID=1930764 RepID=UPI0009C19E0A|nr:tyrosine-type recombinase/integrase [Sporosarcina sp. P33]ARD47607.1 integrase [Sporosarcina sp. P33]
MAVKKDDSSKKWFFYGMHPNGKQYKRRGFRTKKEAQTAELKYLDEYENTEPGDDITFEVLAEEYLQWYEKRRKASSYIKISSIINTHLIPHFGDVDIKSIRPRDVTKYQDTIIGNFKPSHVKKIHTTLAAVLKHAVKQEYLKTNAATIAGNVELEEDKHINYWTLDEFKQFISVVNDPLYHALFMTLYYSGMRKGELLALTWGDIDFENNSILVNKTEYNRKVTSTKTKASNRTIVMPGHVMRLLSGLKSKNDKMTYVVFGEFHDSLSTSTLDRRYDRYIEESGVKRIRIHDFRHSHASYLINKGIIISVVAARLGHSDPATTLNVYSHLYPTTEKEAVLTMEDDFKPVQILKFKS